jgi:hypothetical protein
MARNVSSASMQSWLKRSTSSSRRLAAKPTSQWARKGAVEAVTAEADRFAANVLPIIREAQKAGATSLRTSQLH